MSPSWKDARVLRQTNSTLRNPDIFPATCATGARISGKRKRLSLLLPIVHLPIVRSSVHLRSSLSLSATYLIHTTEPQNKHDNLETRSKEGLLAPAHLPNTQPQLTLFLENEIFLSCVVGSGLDDLEPAGARNPS